MNSNYTATEVFDDPQTPVFDFPEEDEKPKVGDKRKIIYDDYYDETFKIDYNDDYEDYESPFQCKEILSQSPARKVAKWGYESPSNKKWIIRQWTHDFIRAIDNPEDHMTTMFFYKHWNSTFGKVY